MLVLEPNTQQSNEEGSSKSERWQNWGWDSEEGQRILLNSKVGSQFAGTFFLEGDWNFFLKGILHTHTHTYTHMRGKKK